MKSYSKKIFLIIFTLLPFYVSAVGFFETEEREVKDSEAKTRGNWFYALGARYENAENDFSFTGNQSVISPDKSIALLGGELRLGRELSLGGMFSLIISIEGFYSRNDEDNSEVPKAEDIDIAISEDSIKTISAGIGGYASLGLFPFKIKSFTILPILEMGLGSGRSSKEVHYYYDDTVSKHEYYKESYKQDFVYAKMGLGFNIIAPSGVFSYFRFYSTQYEFESSTDGKRSESYQANGANPTIIAAQRGSSSQNIFTTSIGFGYRF